MAGSKGYNSRAYVSDAPGSFYAIYAADFGAPVPVLVTLTTGTNATASLSTTGNVFVQTTWVTAEGESAASTEVSVAINTTTQKHTVIVQQPIIPTNGSQTVLGWRIYSAYTTGGELLNTVPDGTVTGAAVAAIAISTNTSATQTIYAIGAGQAAPVGFDSSGIQPALNSIAANTTADYFAVVPNSGSQWKQQKSVEFMKSDGATESTAIVLNHLDFIQPVYPGASGQPTGGTNPPVSTYTQATVAAGTWMVMNGYLFQAIQVGSQSTATTFIGWAAFNTPKGKTTTDGSVTWLSYGKAGLVRFHFGNVSATATVPTATAYELFQL
jgi:hypothetical protein